MELVSMGYLFLSAGLGIFSKKRWKHEKNIINLDLSVPLINLRWTMGISIHEDKYHQLITPTRSVPAMARTRPPTEHTLLVAYCSGAPNNHELG
jgi:hypothetical protein